MKAKKVWWAVAATVIAAAVGTTAAVGFGVQRYYGELDHGEPFAMEQPQDVLAPVQPGPAPDLEALAAALDAAAEDPALGEFAGQVIDTATGEVVWSRDAGELMVPASSTKVLTAAAATIALGENDRIVTEVVRGEQPDSVVIKAAGDVWLSLKQLDELAQQIDKAGGADAVYIDTSAWAGPDQAEGWDPDNIPAGFAAPMQPAMVYGARQGEATGDVPRSYTPALDVASMLGSRLGTETVGTSPAPADAEVIASVESAPLSQRAQQMMKDSDNVAAEAIGREIAAAAGAEKSFEGATHSTVKILQENGFDTEDVVIADNSGLSDVNRIPVSLLAQLVYASVDNPQLRPLAGYLPVAGGDGTLATRYEDSEGRGWVRAKTGTLTGISALVGTTQSQSGRVYAFATLVNGSPDILGAREAQDNFASALHQF